MIVEQVPGVRLEQGFAAQVLVYDDDETYLMQGVAEEQEVETEVLETGENTVTTTTILSFSADFHSAYTNLKIKPFCASASLHGDIYTMFNETH